MDTFNTNLNILNLSKSIIKFPNYIKITHSVTFPDWNTFLTKSFIATKIQNCFPETNLFQISSLFCRNPNTFCRNPNKFPRKVNMYPLWRKPLLQKAPSRKKPTKKLWGASSYFKTNICKAGSKHHNPVVRSYIREDSFSIE